MVVVGIFTDMGTTIFPLPYWYMSSTSRQRGTYWHHLKKLLPSLHLKNGRYSCTPGSPPAVTALILLISIHRDKKPEGVPTIFVKFSSISLKIHKTLAVRTHWDHFLGFSAWEFTLSHLPHGWGLLAVKGYLWNPYQPVGYNYIYYIVYRYIHQEHFWISCWRSSF